MIKNHQKSLNGLHVFVNLILAAVAYAVAYPIRFLLFPVQGKFLPFESYMRYLWLIIPGYLLIFAFSDLYKPQRANSLVRELWDIIRANFFGGFYTLAMLYLVREIDISRTFIIIFVVLNLLFDIFFRAVTKKILHTLRKKGYNLKHILMVGYSRTAEQYIDVIRSNPQWGYSIYGILDDKMEKGTKYKNVSVIGSLELLGTVLEKKNKDLDEVVITLKLDDYPELAEIVRMCEKYGLHIKFLPDYGGIASSATEIEELDGLPIINIRRVPLAKVSNRVCKRIADIIFTLIALIIFAIPMLIIAALIKCTSKGPAIYVQKRVGLHNREFSMYKFRSMELQEEVDEKKAWTTYKDARVTKIGKFIRKTSLDELPQLFNVLKGDMSLVGPRPERPYFVDTFKEEIPRYMVKHQVRPGITGWAQVKGYRGDTSITKRIECDLYYIENWNPWFDFLIMFLTIFRFAGKNAY